MYKIILLQRFFWYHGFLPFFPVEYIRYDNIGIHIYTESIQNSPFHNHGHLARNKRFGWQCYKNVRHFWLCPFLFEHSKCINLTKWVSQSATKTTDINMHHCYVTNLIPIFVIPFPASVCFHELSIKCKFCMSSICPELVCKSLCLLRSKNWEVGPWWSSTMQKRMLKHHDVGHFATKPRFHESDILPCGSEKMPFISHQQKLVNVAFWWKRNERKA